LIKIIQINFENLKEPLPTPSFVALVARAILGLKRKRFLDPPRGFATWQSLVALLLDPLLPPPALFGPYV